MPEPLNVPAPLITFAACGINKPVTDIVPPIAILLLDVTPVALETVRLFSAVTFDGIATLVELPPKDKLEAEVVARLVAVPAMTGPFNVNVLAPTVKVPEVKVS